MSARSILVAALTCFVFTHQLFAANLNAEVAQANQLLEQIPISEIMGPLAPIALSPFFGLTCLSGICLLTNRGILPENTFISEQEMLNSEISFFVLLMLTLITSIPKFSKVSKSFAQLTDHLEAYAGIVAYTAILVATHINQPSPEEITVVYTAGIFSLSADSLVILLTVINIIVIHTVKFFFELLAFISPVPAVDAAFEVLNKTTVTALMFIYSLSPAVAFALNILIFLCALILFRWARTWIKYFREIVLLPTIRLLIGKYGHNHFSLDRKKVPPKLRKHLDGDATVIPAFPLRKSRKWRKRQRSYLFVTADLCILACHKLFANPMVETYDSRKFTAEMESGLLTNRVVFIDRQTGVRMPVVFSRQYSRHSGKIGKLFGVEIPANKFEITNPVSALREILRGKEDRSVLYAEIK